jgi:hypothetical protein
VKTILAALVVICGCDLVASPIDDLASPLQETRDAAAKILQATYTPPPRTNWDSFIASIKVGDSKTNILAMLRQHNFKPEGGGGSGTFECESFRLDDLWMLELSSERDLIVSCKLREQMRHVWVVPSPKFTGVWIVYFANGQKSHEINYADGSYFGEFVAFNPDGSKCYVQHLDHQIAEGADIGYFPSGRIKYQGFYRTNTQVGTWIWYNEDGTTNSIKDYSKP